MRKVLTKNFFEQPAMKVAKNLLGKYLVRRLHEKSIASMITEVEVYDGPEDRASHAFRGLTPGNKPMFGPAGYWYVYLVYGIHWMLNIVIGPKNYPSAILIRAIDSLNGPGRLTNELRIRKNLNDRLANKKTGLWIEDRGVQIQSKNIKAGQRVGVAYAGKTWSKKPYRLYIKWGL